MTRSSILGSLNLPSPLMRASRPGLYFKRDDLLGKALGGHKLRKLAYILAQAKDDGVTALITTGRVQSNSVHLAGIMGSLHGFKVSALLLAPERAGREKTLNERVSHQLGIVEHTIIDDAANRPHLAEIFDERVSRLTASLEAEGETVRFIPSGCSCPEGTLAFVDAYDELRRQMNELGLDQYTIVLAVGTGSSFAGLWCGSERDGADITLRGISIARRNPRCKAEVVKLALPICERLGLRDPSSQDLDIADQYIGGGYSAPASWSELGIEQALRNEGILMDHTYSGKAYGALLQELSSGSMLRETPVVFWHGGGVAGAIDALFDDVHAIDSTAHEP